MNAVKSVRRADRLYASAKQNNKKVRVHWLRKR